MQHRSVPRPADSFQQALTPDEIRAVCSRAFGAGGEVVSAEEIGLGMYNTTYRVALADRDRPVVLRAAPAPQRQFLSERQLMRNEYATMPWLGVIASKLPRVLAADWSHEVIARDWMIQTLLDGVPAPSSLTTYAGSTWSGFYRELGAITRAVHAVTGPHFGPVAGPAYPTWSAAVVASLTDIATDLDGAGLDASDVRAVATRAAARPAVLDEVVRPGLLTGDLWTVNVLLREGAPEPTISGLVDFDRTWWGDPAADWTIYMAQSEPGTEQDAFWASDAYGPPGRSAAAMWRSHVYRARHLGAIRLENHRLGRPVEKTYGEMAEVLADLR
jgi:aminoglycoside phosphotransferase (APT) family kinase protein